MRDPQVTLARPAVADAAPRPVRPGTWGLRLALLAGGVLLLATRALAFEWPGRIRLTAQRLRSARVSTRLAAIQELADYPIHESRGLLLRATRDADDQVRIAAARVLVSHRVAAVLPVLVEWLADFNVSVRAEAAQLLGQLGDPAAVPPLIRVFGDFEHQVRMAAVKALGQLGSRRAVTGILGRLYDPNVKVRRAAIRVLADLADPRAVIPLLGKLADPSREIRQAAVRALARIGDPRAAMPILRLLGDPAQKVRVAAIRALGKLRPPGATPALIQALRRATTATERKALHAALARLATPAALAELIKALLESTATSTIQASVAAAGAPMVPLLVRALDSPSTTARQAQRIVRALSAIGDRRASAALIRELRRDRLDRQLVTEALSTCGDADAVVPLLGLLRRATPQEKRLIVRALEPIVDARFSLALLPLLGDPALEIRKAAVRMLGRLRSRAAVQPLTLLLTHADPSLVRLAVEALGQIGDPRAEMPLLPLLLQGPLPTRRAVVNALSRLGTLRLLERLLAIVEDSDTPPRTRDLALDALAGVLRNRRAGPARTPLLTLLSHQSRNVVAGALTVMAASGDLAFAAPLRARLSRLPAPLRPLAVRALARQQDAATTRVLLQASRAKAWQTRAAAAWALGGRPGTSRRLVALLRDPHPAVRVNAAGALALSPPTHARAALRGLLAARRVNPYLLANVVLALGRCGDRHDSTALLRLLKGARTETNRYLLRNLVRALRRLHVPAQRIRTLLGNVLDPALRAKLLRRKPSSSAQSSLVGVAHRPERWVALTLVDEHDFPSPGASIYVILPDGRVRWCVTDPRGKLFLEQLPPGGQVDYEPVGRAPRP